MTRTQTGALLALSLGGIVVGFTGFLWAMLVVDGSSDAVLAALALLTPPAGIIEPAIALSIVFVGADNLTRGTGRDVRAWVALAFGLVHGFGFASVLSEFGLPREALGWSLFSFNVGVEVGQLAIVLIVASALAAIRTRNLAIARRIELAGSVVVIVAGKGSAILRS